MMSQTDTLLDVRHLRTCYKTRGQTIHAVHDVSFTLQKGRTLGIVGESGCGKTAVALSIMRLLDSSGWIEGGEIYFRGKDLLTLTHKELQRIRGKEISMIFQDPMASLDPLFTIGDQIAEVLQRHEGLSGKKLRSRVIELLEMVEIADPESRAKDYPDSFSGGMRQRVMIAMALAKSPHLLIADEPTTALDVTIQAQIIRLMKKLCLEMGTAIIFISHDLGVISEIADDVAVMYAGQIVEQGPVEKVLKNPLHPYTQGLLAAIPGRNDKGKRIQAIPGEVPAVIPVEPKCSFAPRCAQKMDICLQQMPDIIAHGDQQVRCWLHNGGVK